MKKKTKYQRRSVKKRGFTLIELLVSVGLFTAITSIIVAILFTSLRASKKSEVIVAVKQSGNIALSQMVRGIRYARTLDNPTSCVTPVTQESITVTALDYGQTVYSCPAIASDGISSNSADLVDTNAVVVSQCAFTCSQATLSDPPTITVQFILSPANQTDFSETEGSVPFQTSITLRNFSR